MTVGVLLVDTSAGLLGAPESYFRAALSKMPTDGQVIAADDDDDRKVYSLVRF